MHQGVLGNVETLKHAMSAGRTPGRRKVASRAAHQQIEIASFIRSLPSARAEHENLLRSELGDQALADLLQQPWG